LGDANVKQILEIFSSSIEIMIGKTFSNKVKWGLTDMEQKN